MDKKNWAKIEAEFNYIFDLSNKEREEYFKKLREEQEELYNLVKELWDFSKQKDSFLEGDVYDDFSTIVSEMTINESNVNDSKMEGRLVGKYRIIKQIGHGGMGTVYLATRADGSFDQNVAIKFIRCGMKNDLVVARFKQEQQIQAKLSSPSIPVLFDADIDEFGTPYIVMEYVEGKSITEYVDENNFDLHKKISLFIQICQVIHFAHQNLVVHRDLKPSNILITEKGEYKLLDFGISKLLDENVENDLTITNARLYSIKYAAPEQLQGKPITTATDIYSLGVILHEILCGFMPYKTDSKSMVETEQLICTKPVLKPSTSIIQCKESPLSTKEKLTVSKRFKGDLDNIILKTLEKEPHRRYASVKALSEDLERYLNNETVSAVPAGLLYTTSKFIQRNKQIVTAAFTVLIILLMGGIYHSVTVTAERNAAQLEAKKFQQMSNFLIGLFEYDELSIPPEDATIANLLDAGVNSIDAKLSDNPEVQAEIMLAIGNSYLQLGKIAEGYEMTIKAVDIFEELPKDNTISKSQVYLYLANANYENDQTEALQSIDKAISIAKTEYGVNSQEYAEALWLKGKAVYRADGGKSIEAEEIMDTYLEIIQQIFPEKSPEYALAVSENAAYKADLNERIDALKNAIEVNKSIHGKNHPRVANILNTLGFYYRTIDQKQSIKYFEQSIDIYSELYGDAHFRTINSLTNLGDTYRRNGQLNKAIATFQRAVNAAKSVYPNGSIRISDPQYWLSNAQIEAGLYSEAEKNLKEVLSVYESNYQPGAQKVEMARSNLGYAISLQGREKEGRLLIEQTLKNVREVHGEEHNLIEFAKKRLN